MKSLFISLCAILSMSLSTTAQNVPLLSFANRIGGTGYEQGYGIDNDSAGNSYVTGAFSGTVDFDPSPSELNLTSNGSSDVYIAKYNSNGGLVWAKSLGSSGGDDFAYDIKVAPNGDVFAGGFISSGIIDADPGSGIYNLTNVSGLDAFIVKLSSAGNFLWAFNLLGSSNSGLSNISIGTDGIYLSGEFSGTIDFDPSSNNQTLNSNGGTDGYFSKYDFNGNLIWIKQIGNSTFDERIYTAIEANNNIYVSGYFQGNIDLDAGLGSNLITSTGGEDIYLAKYDPNGNFLWGKSLSGSENQRPQVITSDLNNNLIITGSFRGTLDFDPSPTSITKTSNGNADAFIAKYDSNGNLIFVLGLGGIGNEEGYGITTDLSNNTYFLCNYQSTTNFDPNGPNGILSPIGQGDIALAKYNSSGQFMFARNFGGNGGDAGWDIKYSNGKLFFTGHFQNTVDFDPSQSVLSLTSLGNFDSYVLNLLSGECINTITIYDTIETLISVTDTLIINTIITSTTPPNNVNAIKVFPNPTSDHITIDYGNFNLMDGYILKIENSQSQLVFQTNIIQQSNYLDLSNWGGNGIYFVRIIDPQGNTIEIKKIILQ